MLLGLVIDLTEYGNPSVGRNATTSRQILTPILPFSHNPSYVRPNGLRTLIVEYSRLSILV